MGEGSIEIVHEGVQYDSEYLIKDVPKDKNQLLNISTMYIVTQICMNIIWPS